MTPKNEDAAVQSVTEANGTNHRESAMTEANDWTDYDTEREPPSPDKSECSVEMVAMAVLLGVVVVVLVGSLAVGVAMNLG